MVASKVFFFLSLSLFLFCNYALLNLFHILQSVTLVILFHSQSVPNLPNGNAIKLVAFDLLMISLAFDTIFLSGTIRFLFSP